VETPAQAPEASPAAGAEAGPKPPVVTDARVQRIVVSCADGLIGLQTLTTTYLYRLDECDAPIGVFDADVSIHATGVTLTLKSEGRPVRFHAGFRVRKGQENPATLLKDQATVPVEVVDSIARAPRVAAGGCYIWIKSRQLIAPKSFFKELFKPIDVGGTLWSKRFSLGEFGWVKIVLEGKAHLSGDVSGSYGPGMLHQICLIRSLGNGRIAGQARFTLPGSFEAGLRGSGQLGLEAKYLSFIPLTSLDGKAALEAHARANGEFDSQLEVIHDLNTGEWQLALSAGLSLEAILGFSISAEIAAKILTRRVWSASWQASRDIGYGWKGGFVVRPDGKFVLNRGNVLPLQVAQEAPTEQLGAAATKGVSDQPESPGLIKELGGAVMKALLDAEQGQVVQDPARDGLSKAKALPLHWHKPPLDDNVYPRRLDLPNAETPKSVDRNAGPTHVAYTGQDGISTYDDFGVKRENWPHVGKTFQLVPGGRSDKEKDRFRKLVSYLGYSREGQHIDHVHELQFGELNPGDALDAFNNLWPVGSSANSSAGTRHRNQVKRFEKQLGSVNGRWFQIVKISI